MKKKDKRAFYVLIIALAIMGLGVVGLAVRGPTRVTQTQTQTNYVTHTVAIPSGWQLDAIAYNKVSGANYIFFNLTHSANCVVFVLILSVTQPDSILTTTDFQPPNVRFSPFSGLTFLDHYVASGFPVVTSYWTTSPSAATGTIQVGWSTNQATAVIIAVSFIISDYTTFVPENHAVTNFALANSATVTQGAGSNPYRLNVFMAYTYQDANQEPFTSLDPNLSAITPIAIYQHPLRSYYVAVGWNVGDTARSYNFTYSNAGLAGIAFCGFDPLATPLPANNQP